MRGQRVIVRTFGGRPLVSRVWDADRRGVYITSDEYFPRLEAGEAAPPPIGFPREDVFEFDPELASRLEELWATHQWRWEKLVRWGESAH